MSKNKGKPSGPDAETKSDVGRKADYKRSGWPEDAPTQHVRDARNTQPGNPREAEAIPAGDGSERNRKAGGPD